MKHFMENSLFIQVLKDKNVEFGAGMGIGGNVDGDEAGLAFGFLAKDEGYTAMAKTFGLMTEKFNELLHNITEANKAETEAAISTNMGEFRDLLLDMRFMPTGQNFIIYFPNYAAIMPESMGILD